VSITEPLPLTGITTVTNTSCGSSTGTASAAVAGGTPPYSYVWTPTAQVTQTALNLAAGVYTCTVTDLAGCTEDFIATVLNSNGPTVTLTASQNVSCYGGSDGSANTNTTGGTSPYTWAWSPSGGNAQNASNLTAGAYALLVTDNTGCTQSLAVSITEPSALNLAATSSPASCSGNNGSGFVYVSGATPPYSYNWTSGGNAATENNLAAGTYTCYVTDDNMCADSAVITVTQPSAVVVSTSVTNVSCFGGADGTATVNPTAGSAPFTYLWSNASTNQTVNGLPGGTYSCSITDATNCNTSVTVTITAPPAVTVSLSGTNVSCFGGADGLAVATAGGGTGSYFYSWVILGGNNDSLIGATAATYTCTVTDMNGCAKADSIQITEPTEVVITSPASMTVCQGQTTTINYSVTGGAPAYNVTFNPNGPTITPTVTTVYYINATDANSCPAGEDTVLVIVNPPLAVTANPAGPICSGQTASLTATGSGGDANYIYTWSPATIPATGQTVSANPATTTTYTVIITDGCGSPADTDYVTLLVNPTPVPVFVLNDSSGCAPFCISFTNNTPNSPACIWQFGDGNFDTLNCNTTHCYTIPNTYDIALTVIDSNGCSGTTGAAALVNVYPTPASGFTFIPVDATILNPVINFTDASNGATGWNWSFGDGPPETVSNAQNPSFEYPVAGLFTVTQIVSNAYGCVDTMQLQVLIEQEATFYIPNAFTPDVDDLNEIFRPEGFDIDVATYEFMIFDRWGNMVYSTTTWGEGWDGNYNNARCQQDVYVWKLTYRSTSQMKTRVYIGHVSLLR
ncbi:MAG TPA: PKD domain-containing protein, partial [Bacteroidia bacterium]|nr:PKD domain-containing protein [Bacteroidia bacterium]